MSANTRSKARPNGRAKIPASQLKNSYYRRQAQRLEALEEENQRLRMAGDTIIQLEAAEGVLALQAENRELHTKIESLDAENQQLRKQSAQFEALRTRIRDSQARYQTVESPNIQRLRQRIAGLAVPEATRQKFLERNMDLAEVNERFETLEAEHRRLHEENAKLQGVNERFEALKIEHQKHKAMMRSLWNKNRAWRENEATLRALQQKHIREKQVATQKYGLVSKPVIEGEAKVDDDMIMAAASG